jgi:hypothetical protein
VPGWGMKKSPIYSGIRCKPLGFLKPRRFRIVERNLRGLGNLRVLENKETFEVKKNLKGLMKSSRSGDPKG